MGSSSSPRPRRRFPLHASRTFSSFMPWFLPVITLLVWAPLYAQAVIFRAANQQCGGLGGSCQENGGTGGHCADAVWAGNTCAAGSSCTRSSQFVWACTPLAPGTGTLPAAPSSCTAALKSASSSTTTEWIDADTPNTACYAPICRSNFSDCNQVNQPLENMVLVFSDEFQATGRNLSGWCDPKWSALDLNYAVNGDVAGYKPEAVTVQGGSAVITVTRQQTTCPVSGLGGEGSITSPYRSGMIQGWNKFCFTGGYMEVRVKLPGDINHTGLWPAVFLLGNLGRAGYAQSTYGFWPYSYDTCDSASTGGQPWSLLSGQKFNRCNSTKGRGATEIDLFEVGIWTQGSPVASTSVQAAPLLPPNTHWLNHTGGMFFPTSTDASNSSFMTRPNDWWGVNSYPLNPRPGTEYQDAISATSNLDASFFDAFHVWGVDWVPGKYVRWYIDGVMIFEANALAFKGMTNAANQSCGDRLVPTEPSYIIMNVAMSNQFTVVDPTIPLPATMEIDYVRVYQSKDSINVGCNPPDFPTSDIINANIGAYYVHSLPDPFTCRLPTSPTNGSGSGSGSGSNASSDNSTQSQAPEDDAKKVPIAAIAVPCALLGLVLLGAAGWFTMRHRRPQAPAQPRTDLEQQTPKKQHAAPAAVSPPSPNVRAVLTAKAHSPLKGDTSFRSSMSSYPTSPVKVTPQQFSGSAAAATAVPAVQVVAVGQPVPRRIAW